MKCSWKGCCKEAIHKLKDRDGNTWGNLCDEHHNELESCIFPGAGFSAKKMLRAWVLAHGGAESLTNNFHKKSNR